MSARPASARSVLAHSLGVLLVVVVAAGCGGSVGDGTERAAREAPDEPAATVEEEDVEDGDVARTEIELEEVEESGIDGTARISPGKGDRLEVEIELEGSVDDTHGVEARVGSCEDALSADAADDVLGDAASYTMTDIQDGRMQDSARLPEEIVSEGTYSLLVYAGPEVEGDIAACADVEVVSG